jgi:RNA polymerase sigma-70 factor (ECF subfamily)
VEPYVPLDEQDTASWDADLDRRGRGLSAARGRVPPEGGSSCEAAIQAVHAPRADGWHGLGGAAHALRRLMLVAPSLGAQVALASVVGRLDGPPAGLAALDDLSGGQGARPSSRTGPSVRTFSRTPGASPRPTMRTARPSH